MSSEWTYLNDDRHIMEAAVWTSVLQYCLFPLVNLKFPAYQNKSVKV